MLLGEELRGDGRRMAGYVCGPCHQPPDLQHMGTATRPAKTAPAPWDAFSDVDAFIAQVLVELAAMAADGTPADAARTQAGAGRGGAAQNGDGDLVRVLL